MTQQDTPQPDNRPVDDNEQEFDVPVTVTVKDKQNVEMVDVGGDRLPVRLLSDEEIDAARDRYTELRTRVLQSLNERELEPGLAQVVFFLPDLFMLILRVLGDQRVKLTAKLELGLAVAYVLTPFDLIPDFIPGLGWLDDMLMVVLVLSRLIAVSGKAARGLLYEHWDGEEDVIKVVHGASVILQASLERLSIVAQIYAILRRFGRRV